MESYEDQPQDVLELGTEVDEAAVSVDEETSLFFT